MKRRTFLGVTLPLMAGVALAKEPKPDRLSGYVKSVEKKDMTINTLSRSYSAFACRSLSSTGGCKKGGFPERL